MEREITHSCGHTQKHDVAGYFAADSDREARRLARQRCGTCYREQREAKATGDQAALAGVDLATLVGSDKQVSWAASIRVERLAALLRKEPAAVQRFATIAEAKWWIDHQSADLATITLQVA